ncbi:MAG: transglycosylase domain-containing protein, partial [Roseovarius sp.]|nr:transglycosylase domain-containing protein [Roseovarius sp.]
MMRYALFVLAAVLLLAAVARDGIDQWVAAMDLPPLINETSIEVRDRNAGMLRIYTVADGRWRLAVTPDQVDPGFLKMLIAYEDKRFYSHAGVDPQAML